MQNLLFESDVNNVYHSRKLFRVSDAIKVPKDAGIVLE